MAFEPEGLPIWKIPARLMRYQEFDRPTHLKSTSGPSLTLWVLREDSQDMGMRNSEGMDFTVWVHNSRLFGEVKEHLIAPRA